MEEVVYDSLALNVRANPCVNRCRHCWAEGSREHATMPTEAVEAALRELAGARDLFANVDFFLLDEPTARPDFVEIYEFAAELELLGPDSFIATNGVGLARAEPDVWYRLRATGIGYLQFTFYGVGEAHDKFAGRRGAFDDLVAAVGQAEAVGMPWCASAILQPRDAGDVLGTLEYIEGLGSPTKTGWMLYAAQGRGGRGRRPIFQDIMEKPWLAAPGFFCAERRLREEILADRELSRRRAAEAFCPTLVLEVDAGGEVFCGGACDSGGLAGVLPELRSEFSLGRLGEKSLAAMVAEYLADPPAITKSAGAVTWGELAEKYASRVNDELFAPHDLIVSRWVRDYVRKNFPPSENNPLPGSGRAGTATEGRR
jgi:MoaA/NifB/PqqE/SkfB family radical SAM enzyme